MIPNHRAVTNLIKWYVACQINTSLNALIPMNKDVCGDYMYNINVANSVVFKGRTDFTFVFTNRPLKLIHNITIYKCCIRKNIRKQSVVCRVKRLV